MAEGQSQRLRLWQGTVETDVEIQGDGPPLVWLHGPWGLAPDREFVARLAATRTVYAPHHPGTTKGDPNAVHRIDNWWDLMIYHGELFDALGLSAPDLAGHSYGAMLAAEIAATMPNRVDKLVLIDAVGLWDDARPVRNWMILPDAERRSALFADPDGAAAEAFFRVPNDPECASGNAFGDDLGAGLHRQVRLADPGPRHKKASAPHRRADADRLGQAPTASRSAPMPMTSPRVSKAPRSR